MPDSWLWIRDHGAAYVVNKRGEKKVVDLGWTLYGYQDYLRTYFEGNQDSIKHYYQEALEKTSEVDSLMGAREKYPSIKVRVNMEGGSIEVNGKGTLILCEAVTFQRNPGLSKDFIESEFKRSLGVSNIIWMKKGWWKIRSYSIIYSANTLAPEPTATPTSLCALPRSNG
ncbi:MAG: agmatine deiminase family protein [Bacteroidia bacterium]|nr:agmatine deiminase family protein [Bacteroidia bacterium]